MSGWLLRLYRRLARLERYLARRFTPLGRLALGVLVVAALFAVDTRRTQAYQLFAVLAALLLVSFLVSLRARTTVEPKRHLPAFATAREPFEYVVELSNPDQRPQQGLWIQDRLTTVWPNAAALKEDKAFRPGWMPWFAYRRWYRVLRAGRGATVDQGQEFDLTAAGRTAVKMTAHPVRRGYVVFEGMELGTVDPLGLCRHVQRKPAAAALVVIPKPWPVELSLRGFGGRAELGSGSVSSGVGNSPEFHSLREYRHGDPLRNIHWRSWARRGEPIVREFQAEATRRQCIVIDHYGVPEGDDRLEVAIQVAAGLVRAGSESGATVSLLTDNDELTASDGREIDDLLIHLATMGMADETRLGDLADRVEREVQHLAGVTLVLARWDGPRHAAVEFMRRLDVELRVVVAVGDDEAEFDAGPMSDIPDRVHTVMVSDTPQPLVLGT